MQKAINLLVIFIITFFTTQCNSIHKVSTAQTKVTENKAEIYRHIESEEMQIDGRLEISTISDANLETILAQPVPEIWLVYSCQLPNDEKTECKQNKLRIELPPEAKTIIEKYWKEGLEFRYQTILKKRELDSVRYEELVRSFSNASFKFTENLEKVKLFFANKNRTISGKEAEEITRFINNASVEVIENAEKFRD